MMGRGGICSIDGAECVLRSNRWFTYVSFDEMTIVGSLEERVFIVVEDSKTLHSGHCLQDPYITRGSANQ